MNIDDVVEAATETYSLPAVCVKLRETLDDPRADFEAVADVISTDPILSAKLLSVANSALFRFSQTIETVHKAISLLGGEATYNLAMANAAGCAIDSFKSSFIDVDKYWFDCLFRGALAKELARHNRIRGSERFFALGVLSRLGEMVIASHFPEQYNKYAELRDTMLPWQAQQAAFGFTIVSASAAICEEWGLPVTLYHPLSKTFSQTGESADNSAEILQLAIKLSFYHYHKAGFEELNGLQPEVSLWKDDDDALHDMLDYCQKEARRLQNTF